MKTYRGKSLLQKYIYIIFLKKSKNSTLSFFQKYIHFLFKYLQKENKTLEIWIIFTGKFDLWNILGWIKKKKGKEDMI